MQFVQSCCLTIKGGNGGNGTLAWRKEAHVKMGGPYGGDGGNGGDVIFIGDENCNNLFHLRKTKIIKAANGENGGNKGKHGANGAHLYVKVPCGTIVTDSQRGVKLFEIMNHNQKQLVCKGGKGGYGNLHFKSQFNPAPTIYERGDLGEELVVKLAVHLIADVGFLGLPNAGKSTLISQCSNAKPKIAPYPFTTLQPVLGTVIYQKQKLVFADVPGIVKTAAQGYGLGLKFLAHLNRCSVLLHLIDGSKGKEIITNYKIIQKELQQYSKQLSNKPQIVVINKIDLGYDQNACQQLQSLTSHPIFLISAKQKTNFKPLLAYLFQLVNHQKQAEKKQIQEITVQMKNNTIPQTITVTKNQSEYQIHHPILAYWVWKLPQNTVGNQLRLKQKFNTWKVNQTLAAAGVKKGQLVKCYDYSWYYQKDSE